MALLSHFLLVAAKNIVKYRLFEYLVYGEDRKSLVSRREKAYLFFNKLYQKGKKQRRYK